MLKRYPKGTDVDRLAPKKIVIEIKLKLNNIINIFKKVMHYIIIYCS